MSSDVVIVPLSYQTFNNKIWNQRAKRSFRKILKNDPLYQYRIHLKTSLSRFPKVPIWTSGPMWSGSSVGNGYGMSFDDGDWFVTDDESPAPRLRSWPYIDPDLRWPDACLVCIRMTVWCLSDDVWSDRLGYFGTGSFLKYSIPTTKVSMISRTAACLSSCGSDIISDSFWVSFKMTLSVMGKFKLL